MKFFWKSFEKDISMKILLIKAKTKEIILGFSFSDIPYRTKLPWEKVPKIWLVAENFIRRNIKTTQ